MRNWLMVAALALAASPAFADTWTGLVRQNDGQRYRVVMRLEGARGRIAYPSLHCGGTLRRIAPGRWREHITYGRETPAGEGCVDRGRIRMLIRGRTMSWTWRAPTGEPDLAARAVLHRR